MTLGYFLANGYNHCMGRPEDKRGGTGCAIGLVLVFMFLPVLYVLSIGPVNLLVENNASLRWIGLIYFPIGLLAEYCPPFGTALDWYMQLWTG